MKKLHVAAAALNQTPLDWDGNARRIISALRQAREHGVDVLCLPELAITGYGCDDAFAAKDLQQRALSSLKHISQETTGLFTVLGLPLAFKDKLYNTAAVIYDGTIYGFVAKQFLANYGIHYERRWFEPWPATKSTEIELFGALLPFGDLVFEIETTRIALEICHDAYVSERPLTRFHEQGVSVVLNPSASHFAFGRGEERRQLVSRSSEIFGVSYVYSNLLGNESGRVLYEGTTLVASGGEILAEGPRLSFEEVLLTSALVEQKPSEVNVVNDSRQAVIKIPARFARQEPRPISHKQAAWESSPQIKKEEFTRAVSLGLFDYMRKSNSHGFVISLSGGADSTACAVLVSVAIRLALASLGETELLKRISYVTELPQKVSAGRLINCLLTCVYQSTKNNSEETRASAETVSSALHAEYLEVDINDILNLYTEKVSETLKRDLSWEQDDIALQNIQARTRAPLIWFITNLKHALLLATSNRSEAAVGYATMDGDTSGGLSPIAGIDKAFLLDWLSWIGTDGPAELGAISQVSVVTNLKPSAELRPLEYEQRDEDDLMPYVVLDVIERLAIGDKLSPVEVLQALIPVFKQYSTNQLGAWVEKFFLLWSRNQWKRERLAPSFHLDDQNLDPKTWCRFPILSGGFKCELKDLKHYLARQI